MEELNKYLNELVVNNVTPGFTYAIISDRDYYGAVGYKSLFPQKEETNLDTLYDIASLTKVLVVLPLIFKLVENGKIKLAEPFTKAIALYLTKYLGCYCIIKNKDTRIDANSDIDEEYKKALIKCVNDNDIRLVLDLHGAKETRDFDVELGTLNNLTADFSSIRELEESFLEHGINDVTHNCQFKGGVITKIIYGQTNADVIQIEINKKFRDLTNIDRLEKICLSLVSSIKMYVNNCINRVNDIKK